MSHNKRSSQGTHKSEKSLKISSEGQKKAFKYTDIENSPIISSKEEEIGDLEYEDPFGDEFEDEEIENEEEDETYEKDDEDAVMSVVSPEKENEKKQIWRPGVDQIQEGETLDYDPSAYIMYHSFRTEWPCLSFDFLVDNLGDNRQRFPLTMYLITGSQADNSEKNKLTFLKLSELHKTYVKPDNSDDEDDDSNADDDNDLDDDPTIEHFNVSHPGAINRIRCMPQTPGIVATMADTGVAHIYDMTTIYHAFNQTGARPPLPSAMSTSKPIHSFSGHKSEGFAIDWSQTVSGRLISGDSMGAIHVWNPSESSQSSNKFNGGWKVDATPYLGHKGSVEDLQWSPTEATVFASASADNSVRVWDVRGRKGPQISLESAHSEDVNVISWNKSVSYLVASGSDDGSFKVWDLRSIRNKSAPLANFNYHKSSVTSIEWAPYDESVLGVASSDNQVTIWDLSVEADNGENQKSNQSSRNEEESSEFPSQLLFIHQGQFDVKELHFHPQIPGTIVTTAEDSFNIFKPAITVST